ATSPVRSWNSRPSLSSCPRRFEHPSDVRDTNRPTAPSIRTRSSHRPRSAGPPGTPSYTQPTVAGAEISGPPRPRESLEHTHPVSSLPPELSELKQSLVTYGIPDLTGTSLGSSKEREEFRRTIQSVILLYEPRLKKLYVSLRDQTEAIDRTIRFHIEAILQAEPAPEPVAFDSTLRLTTGSFEVK